MLQELRADLTAAESLVAEIDAQLRVGDPAEELCQRLAEIVAGITRGATAAGPELPPDVGEQIARLVSLVRTTVAVGEDWLDRTAGLELATQNVTRRVRRAYGLPARPG